MRFGISTHLYHDTRLAREHLVELKESGFEAIELFATRSHFDYHDVGAIETLATWLDEVGLTLHSVHAPINESFIDGRWGTAYSIAASAEHDRRQAVHETRLAIGIAHLIPFEVLVVHGGSPQRYAAPGDNQRGAMVRSLDEIVGAATEVGVRTAVEVIPNALSETDALVRLLEDELDLPGTGICLDFGHALLLGDPVEAVETASGFLISTHVHDNDGRDDRHYVPFDGIIDWEAALMAMQKIGYDRAWIFEVANLSTPGDVLAKTRRARDRFESLWQAQVPFESEG